MICNFTTKNIFVVLFFVPLFAASRFKMFYNILIVLYALTFFRRVPTT